MGTPIRAKIDSFVSKRYIAAIIQNKDIRKHCCKKRMNLATNNGNTWSDKTVLFGH